MNLYKAKDRRRLRRRLLDGSVRRRVGEAQVMLPEIVSTIARLHARREEAKLRYAVLGGGEHSEAPLPAASPIQETKAKVFRLWATLILAVEIFLSACTASLTITGGWQVHLLAGIAATILFTGIAKIGASTRIDSGRVEHSANLLEQYLLWIVIAIALVLICLFMGRFFAAAELIFVVTSSALSFLVALLVGVCWTLAEVLAAPHREIARFTQLSLLADELADLHTLAERTAQGRKRDHDDTASLEADRHASNHRAAAVASTVLIAMLCLPVDALTLWVDRSGSLDPGEFDRVRTVLMEPLPLLEQGDPNIAVGSFATELDTLKGPSHRWPIPARKNVACPAGESLFATTRKAREAACREAVAASDTAWHQAFEATLSEYRTVLTDLDVTEQAAQTCLHPLLGRVVSSAEREVVVTDGGNAGCGPEPSEPQFGGAGSMVILVPDAEGAGVAARMREREENLRGLYPDLVVIPSWKISDAASLAGYGKSSATVGVAADSNESSPER